MPFKIQLSVFIREYLWTNKRATANEIHAAYRAAIKEYAESHPRKRRLQGGSYANTRRYMYMLLRLGLIRRVAKEEVEDSAKWDRVYYAHVPDRYMDQAWLHPQGALFPATRVGSKHYVPQGLRKRKPRKAPPHA